MEHKPSPGDPEPDIGETFIEKFKIPNVDLDYH